MKIPILVIKFLFIGALFIISNNHLLLTDSHQRDVFFSLYFDWLSNVYEAGVGLTAYVINSEWLPASANGTEVDRGFFGQKLTAER